MAQDTHHMNSFKRQWRSRLASVSRFCPSSLWSLSSKCKTGHMNGFKRGWRRSEWPRFLWLLLGKRPSSFYHLSMETGSIFFLLTYVRGERRRRWGNGGQPLPLRPFLSPLSVQTTQHRVGQEASSKPTTYFKITFLELSAEDCPALYPSKVWTIIWLYS